ncbi:MAG: CHAT domain-containing protein [Steroidobacteraceae bacterium]
MASISGKTRFGESFLIPSTAGALNLVPKKQLMTAIGLKATHGQQTQNQLDYLARYGLILRDKNGGSVSDGSHYVFSKEPHVRAHRQNIVKYADKPALAKKTPTKRNQVIKVVGMKTITLSITRSALRSKKRLDVLYLMANPIKRHALRVDAEVSKVSEEIRRSRFRDNITLHQSPAANLDAIIRGLNDHRPRIVHFSGHGNSGGVAVDDGGIKRARRQFVTFETLGRAFRATDTPPDVVVLNACNSAGARKALLASARAIVVMQDSISDVGAVAFATKFYGGIASGQSLRSSFEQGVIAIESVSLDETSTPALFTANGVNAAKLKLV